MTGKLGRQLLDVTDQKKREVLGRLTKLWQSKADSSQSTLTRRVMDEFMTMARTIHFCLTPLLFLPKWRYQAQATRQRGTDGEYGDAVAIGASSSSLDEMATRKIRRHVQDEKDHELLIVDFMQDYITYIQTGISSISLMNRARSTQCPHVVAVGFIILKVEDDHDRHPLDPIYLQKSLPGGMLVYEIGVSQPFIYTKLHAVEFTRFSLKRNQFYPQHTALVSNE